MEVRELTSNYVFSTGEKGSHPVLYAVFKENHNLTYEEFAGKIEMFLNKSVFETKNSSVTFFITEIESPVLFKKINDFCISFVQKRRLDSKIKTWNLDLKHKKIFMSFMGLHDIIMPF